MEEKDLTQDTTTEDTTSTDSSTENKEKGTTEESSTQDKTTEDANKTVPFHEDPKVQDFIRRQVESKKEQWLQEAESKISEKFAPKEEAKIPSWFGGDESQWKEFSGYLESQSDAKAKQAVEEYKAEQAKQSDLVAEATKHMNSSFAEIESDKELNPAGKKLSESDRNELLKFAYDNYLVDSQGRWDYKKAYKFMPKSNNTDNLDSRKNLASKFNSEDKAESAQRDYKIADDFKGGGRVW